MKKIFFLLLTTLYLAGGPATAQDWKDALKNAATTAGDKASDGKLTQLALVGTWNYAKPGVKFDSGDALNDMGSAMLAGPIAGQLEKAYLSAGIKPGSSTFTFAKDATFKATIDAQVFSGTYEFDPATHTITFHFTKEKVNLGAIPGRTYLNGEQLMLVFPVNKLVEIVKSTGAKIPSLDSVMPLLEKAQGLYIGFEFNK